MTDRTHVGAAGLGVVVGRLLERARPWLPPINRREFWWVQGLVLGIAGGHDLIETLGRPATPPALYLMPTSLFFVPVVYAALNFGLRGSLATASWCAFLTLPNVLFWHSGAERIGVIWQLGILLAVAAFVGQRVDRETRARQDAEEREKERRTSEARYRGLFDHAGEGVFLLEPDGTIVEANATAARLLGTTTEALAGAALRTVLGASTAEQVLRPAAGEVVPLRRPGQPPIWVQPIVHDPGPDVGQPARTQLMFQDVTQQYERRRDLEAYARQTLAAREEEQHRIGRELHDGPLQTIVLLSRKLDEIDTRRSARGPAATEARELAESTADELRRISRALRPSVLDDLGIAVALKSEAAALARRSGLHVRFAEVGEEAPLPEDVELTLLRITQEALHNVERHAAAANVALRLTWAKERVVVVIRDDGRGLGSLPSASDLLEAGKLGVVGMQERARLAGGEVRLEGRLGRGTTVEAVLPLAGDQAGVAVPAGSASPDLASDGTSR